MHIGEVKMYHTYLSAYWSYYFLNKFQPWTEEEEEWLRKPIKPAEKT
jgi:hypothetical protein